MKSKLIEFLVLLSLCLMAQRAGAGQIFVIEAEDFDHDAGQHPAATDMMPYYGGACDGLGAVAETDYHFGVSQTYYYSDAYRLGEDPNVLVAAVSSESYHRGEWDVTVNYRISLVSEASQQWFNYTRNFPPGEYRAYAALSWRDFSPGKLHGELAVVAAGAGTPTQTLQPLAACLGDGGGGWDAIVRVPFMQGGQPAVLSFGGPVTLRYTAISGEYDYLLFLPKDAPYATVSPSRPQAPAGGDVTLVANVTGEGPNGVRCYELQSTLV